jgi:hypothetical protein
MEDYWINTDLFLNYIFTTPWSIEKKNVLILGLKKVTYTLNPELFKYKHINENK